jgi:TolB-like protein/Tfp pilus assembly protein PilF
MRRENSVVTVKPAFNSIAVLPFKTIGEGDEHLGLGVADALITRLSRVRRIGVRPISAVHRFTALGQDPIAAGRALGVDAVLDGRVQRADRRIRVTVELISVKDGRVLWTETLDEHSDDIFKLQDVIAARVVGSLPAALTSEERALVAKRHTTNPEAYEAYLKGRFFWNKRTQEGFTKAVDHFRQAVRLDPGYAQAYAGLADCYVLGADPLPLKEHTRRLKETAGRALELDETLAEAHASLAYYVGAVEWNWEEAEKGFQRAIELNPGYATAHHWYAYHLAAMGRLEEAVAEIERSRVLDPLSLIINTDVGHILYFARRFDEAIDQYRRVLDMDANFAVAHLRLSEAYLAKGMYAEAVAEYNEAKRLGVANPEGWLGYAHAIMGRTDEAQREVAELKRLTESSGSGCMYRLAKIYTALGNHDQALAWLESTYEARDTGELALIKVDPMLADLRSHPRFERLLRRMKLAG